MGFPAFFLVNIMAKQKIKVIREEMLQVANNVAQEKNIDQDSVFSAMEQALEKSARIKYGNERDIRVNIDRNTGDIILKSFLEKKGHLLWKFISQNISPKKKLDKANYLKGYNRNL